MIAATDITHGHILLSDWLFLIAAIVFALEFLLLLVGRSSISRGVLPAVGLCLISIAWLVL